MESLRGCGRALQLPIVGLGSSIDDRTMSNFRRVSASAKIDRAPCLFFVFLSPLHHFKIPQKPIFAGVVVWKNISDAPSIGLSRATSITKLTATFDSSSGASALTLGERSHGLALHLYPDRQGILPKGLQNLRSGHGVHWGYPKNSVKDKSANDTTAKPEVQMSLVRKRQQNGWVKGWKVMCANVSSASVTSVRSDVTPKFCETAASAFRMDLVFEV